jgi:cysteinyl-tRNA synthetase
MKDAGGADAHLDESKTESAGGAFAAKLRESMEKFDAALDDDFNTAQALGFVFDAARLINHVMTVEKKMSPAAKQAVLETAGEAFRHFGDVLGMFQSDPDLFFSRDRDIEAEKRGIDIARTEALIAERQKARDDKDWGRADEIRRELALQGIALKDAAGRTTWIID